MPSRDDNLALRGSLLLACAFSHSFTIASTRQAISDETMPHHWSAGYQTPGFTYRFYSSRVPLPLIYAARTTRSSARQLC